MKIPGGADSMIGRRRCGQVWGNAEATDPSWARVRGQRSARVLGRRFAAGLQLLLCCLLQGLRLHYQQPWTKVLPVQSRVGLGTTE